MHVEYSKSEMRLHSALFLAAGALFATASFFPATKLALCLGAILCILIPVGVEYSQRLYRDFFLFGLAFHGFAFYWLAKTISFFGGFPTPLAWFLFALFCAVSSIQFLLLAWLYQHARQTLLSSLSLALPLSWMTCELFVPRLFPWSLTHLFLSFESYSGLAEFVGVSLLSTLPLFWGELAKRPLLDWIRNEHQSGTECRYCPKTVGTLAAVSFVLLAFEAGRTNSLQREIAALPGIHVALIQGNLDAKTKGDVHYLTANLGKYRSLSQEATTRGAELLLWPESVMNTWTPESVESIRGTQLDPFPGGSVPMIYGGLSFRKRSAEEMANFPIDASQEEFADYSLLRFNTAFAISEFGKVTGRYHKRVLMPFGEYLPFAESFPWIRKLSPQTGEFSAGDLLEPLRIPWPPTKSQQTQSGAGTLLAPVSLIDEQHTLSFGTLICYEDLIPALSLDAVNRGAQVLVNLTNDAWYGETAAPYQHHLLASWRAIETRRYFLRATNTGVTGIVDPFGKTVAQLPIFTSGVLDHIIHPLEIQTTYSKYGELPCQVVALITVCFALLSRKRWPT